MPVDYNKIIESQAQMNNVGFIISFASKEELKKYTLDFKLESGMEIVLADDGKAIKREKKLQIQVKNQQWWKIQHQEMIQHSLVEVILEMIQEITLIREAMQVSHNSSYRKTSGIRTKLTDESGNIIQLRGVSTHGISWFPDYVNYDAFATLRDDWGANVVRIAMYLKNIMDIFQVETKQH